MKQVAYKGPRDSKELPVGDQLVVVSRSDFGKGGSVKWIEVPNDVADSLPEEEWAIRSTTKSKKAGDS